MPKSRIVTIPVSQLFFDQELQMREGFDEDHLEALISHIKAGGELPPIKVFPAQGSDPIGRNGEHYYIADGNHRGMAHRRAGVDLINVEQMTGGRSAALKHALGANAEHNALRRTNRDKRKAVFCALNSYSTIFGETKIKNVAVAEACRVAESFVRKIRLELKGEKKKRIDGKSRDAEQLFLNLFFNKRRGAIPQLKEQLESPDFAQISQDKWAELHGELKALTEMAEERAGLTL